MAKLHFNVVKAYISEANTHYIFLGFFDEQKDQKKNLTNPNFIYITVSH